MNTGQPKKHAALATPSALTSQSFTSPLRIQNVTGWLVATQAP